MSKLLRRVVARVNRAALRERGLFFLAGLALLLMLWNQGLMLPLAARRAVLAQSLEETRGRLSAASAGHDQGSLTDRYAELKGREAALGAALADTDTQLHAAQVGMIEPQQMLAVLTQVLGHQRGLTLVMLRNLPVEALLPPAGAGAGLPPAGAGAGLAPAAMGPYLHPVELVLRGDYLNVLAYLTELEARPWGLQWRRFELVATEDGAEYRIEFTTLSMQSNWLGV